MADVRLIMPNYGEFQVPQQPLGLYFLKAYLESDGISTEVSDFNITGEKFGKESFVGITVTTVLFSQAAKIIKEAKKRGKIVIAGGVHAFADPVSLLNAGADHVVVGDGEYALEKIVLAYEVGETPDKILSIPVTDMDVLPLPDWVPYGNPNRAIISTSRGCPWQHRGGCCFCTPHMGKHWRPMSAERVGEWLAKLDGKDIEVVDDNFTVDKKRVLAIEKIIRKEKLALSFTFGNGLRINTMNREMLLTLRRLPTEDMAYGVESIHDDVLLASGKGQTRALIDDTIKRTADVGLKFHVFMIIGLPLDTFPKTMQNLEWVRSNNLRAYWNIATPYPKTTLYDWVNENGRWLIDKYDYSQYGGHFTKIHVPFDTIDFPVDDRLKAFAMCQTTVPYTCGKVKDFAIKFKGREVKKFLKRVRNSNMPFRRLLFGITDIEATRGTRVGETK